MRSLWLFVKTSSGLGAMLLAWAAFSLASILVVFAAHSMFGIPGLVVSIMALFLLGSALAERHLW